MENIEVKSAASLCKYCSDQETCSKVNPYRVILKNCVVVEANIGFKLTRAIAGECDVTHEWVTHDIGDLTENEVQKIRSADIPTVFLDLDKMKRAKRAYSAVEEARLALRKEYDQDPSNQLDDDSSADD